MKFIHYTSVYTLSLILNQYALLFLQRDLFDMINNSLSYTLHHLPSKHVLACPLFISLFLLYMNIFKFSLP